jgi:hypothetical protein
VCAAIGEALQAFTPKNAPTISKIQVIEPNFITL